MTRLLFLLASVLVLVTTLTGCPWASLSDLDVRDARLVSNVAGLTLEATQTTAELLYELEQRTVKEKALREDGMTKTELRRRLVAVRARWDSVRELLVAARAAHARLAAAFESGNELAVLAPAAEYAATEALLVMAMAEVRERVLGD